MKPRPGTASKTPGGEGRGKAAKNRSLGKEYSQLGEDGKEDNDGVVSEPSFGLYYLPCWPEPEV